LTKVPYIVIITNYKRQRRLGHDPRRFSLFYTAIKGGKAAVYAFFQVILSLKDREKGWNR
jgi:hypothetical protein